MMGYTDRHFRRLLRMISPHALMYSEMVTTGALLHGDAPRFLAHGDDAPCALQLGGSDPAELGECARLAELAGYQEVNLNVGCPSDRVQHGGIGACLMATPARVAACIEAMREAVDVPVTVKCRIGIDDHDDFAFLRHFIETVHAAGCRVFIVHARKALLAGLSPRQNRHVPPLRYEYVYRARRLFPDSTFVLNGGIGDAATAMAQLQQVDGVMLGRACQTNPWLLDELEQLLFSRPAGDRLRVLSDYRNYIEDEMRKGENFRHLARHLLGFFTGCRGARAFRRYLSEHMSDKDAGPALIDQALRVARLDEQVILRTGT